MKIHLIIIILTIINLQAKLSDYDKKKIEDTWQSGDQETVQILKDLKTPKILNISDQRSKIHSILEKLYKSEKVEEQNLQQKIH